jgi:hypothetical protein
VASNLACVGLAVADDDELQRLISRTVRRSRLIGRRGGVAVRRWEDPSGARLVFGMRFGSVLEVLPSFATPRTVSLGAITDVDDEVSAATVLDGQGQPLAAVAFELEERRLLDASMRAGGTAALVALGHDVVVHDPPPGDQAATVEASGGLAMSEQGDATARLIGVVLHGERRTNALTGQSFAVARVRAAGCQLQLCLPGTEHPGAVLPGQVVTGQVFLTAAVSGTGRHGRFGRARRDR